VSGGIEAVVAAVERSGRPCFVRNGEISTRCPICGDSTKNALHHHFYLSLTPPHPYMCQRCGAKGGHLTVEILDGLGAAERDAAVYVREVEKAERRSGRSKRRQAATLGPGAGRLVIPEPSRSDPLDLMALEYIEDRIGGDPLSHAEIQRYKIIACGLYGFLEANGVGSLTQSQREADRLNETCVGFLSSDESYVIFRSVDPNHRGRRYTNYRVWPEWEGSKSFACRADVSLLAPSHRVVVTEGIIDLIQTERVFYTEKRWEPDFVGLATCGASHETILRQVTAAGLLTLDVDLYIDRESGMLERVRRIPGASPFFRTPGFRMRVFQNTFAGVDHKGQPVKDMGVRREFIRRVQVKV
jgi:hypothetical protein